MTHGEGTTVENEPPHGVDVERVLGRYTRGIPGPLVVVLAGLHGNEPAGTEAAISVIDELERLDLPLAGRVIALSGNRVALRRGCRYVTRDLNRCWTDDRIARIRAGDPADDDSEQREMRELLEVLEAEFDEDFETAFVLDLHSTSALGAPFSILADTLQNRAIARFLPIPVIMGLEERIEGPLLSWLAGRGHAAIVVEGGQHEDPTTVHNHEAAIWLTLVAAGAIDYDACPAIDEGYRRLKSVCRGLPGVVEVSHNHALSSGDGFMMRAGYENFQRVHAGDILANDRQGDIRAPVDGFMLMPLYQGQGTDGFFLCIEASRSWLAFSTWARTSGLEAHLPALPGVDTHPEHDCSLLVDRTIGPVVEWWLRLFGYRKHTHEGGREVYARRRETGMH